MTTEMKSNLLTEIERTQLRIARADEELARIACVVVPAIIKAQAGRRKEVLRQQSALNCELHEVGNHCVECETRGQKE